jgi:hypothetical protein
VSGKMSRRMAALSGWNNNSSTSRTRLGGER